MTIVGTVRANRRELPKNLSTHQNRALYSTVQAVNNSDDGCRTLLVSYVAKRNKVVNLLSTNHRKSVCDHATEKRKPDVVLYYNKTKGGVDATDERVGTYSVKFKCRRWHVIVFCNLLDLSALNGFVVHSIFDPQWNNKKLQRRRLYLLALGNALVQEHIQRRQPVQLPAAEGQAPFRDAQKRGICVRCNVGNRKKCSIRCDECNLFVCKDHFRQLCNLCAAN